MGGDGACVGASHEPFAPRAGNAPPVPRERRRQHGQHVLLEAAPRWAVEGHACINDDNNSGDAWQRRQQRCVATTTTTAAMRGNDDSSDA